MGNIGLPSNWVVQPAIDLELKHFTLLAYLQRVRGRFAEFKLYPHLEEVRMRLDELLMLRKRKQQLADDMAHELSGFDPATGKAIYERVEEDALLSVVDAVIDLAVPGLQRIWNEGVGLRHDLAGSIHLEPVGVQPLNPQRGWLMLRTGNQARVYGYSFSLWRDPGEEHQYRSVVTRYEDTYQLGITRTYEHIKTELQCRHPELPTPATFVFETDMGLPHIETFMPLAKQLVYERITRPA